jgi:predicted exporter
LGSFSTRLLFGGCGCFSSLLFATTSRFSVVVLGTLSLACIKLVATDAARSARDLLLALSGFFSGGLAIGSAMDSVTDSAIGATMDSITGSAIGSAMDSVTDSAFGSTID